MAALGLRCCARASHCGGLSRCGAWDPGTWASVAVARRLQHSGSAVVAHGPSRSAACGILPDQGSNLRPLHWQADPQPLRHQGSPSDQIFVFTLWCNSSRSLLRKKKLYVKK